jgi:hypothetical protein
MVIASHAPTAVQDACPRRNSLGRAPRSGSGCAERGASRDCEAGEVRDAPSADRIAEHDAGEGDAPR